MIIFKTKIVKLSQSFEHSSSLSNQFGALFSWMNKMLYNCNFGNPKRTSILLEHIPAPTPSLNFFFRGTFPLKTQGPENFDPRFLMILTHLLAVINMLKYFRIWS